MVDSTSLLSAAKDVGKYVMITFTVYFIAIVMFIIGGFLEETVIPGMGLNTSGSAYTEIMNLFTSFYTAVQAIVAIVTVITGLLTLMVVLKAFGINLKLDFGMGNSRV